LASFDANNLSAEDIKSIHKIFKSENIRPNAGLKAEIEAGGPRGVGNSPPPPPPTKEDLLSTFLKPIEEYRDQKPGEKAIQKINDKWLEAGNSVGNSFV
jgi:hypothetical protein